MVLLRSSEAPCSVHNAPGPAEQDWPLSFHLSFVPFVILFSHPTSKRRCSLYQDVGEWSPTPSFKHQLKPAKGAAIF